MIRNIFSFILGAIGGIVGLLGFWLLGQFFGFGFSWELYVWAGIVGLVGGMIKSFSKRGYGILSFLVFLIGSLAMIGLSIYGAINAKNLVDYIIVDGWEVTIETGEYTMAIVESCCYGMIGVTGLLILSWYIIIGKGTGGHPFLVTLGLVVGGFALAFVGSYYVGKVFTIAMSSVICGLSLIIVIILRIKNGSALDY